VALAWIGYSLGLLPAACGMVVVRLFNAMHENGVIFRVGIVLLVVNAACDYMFLHVWGLVGICLSTSFVYLIAAVCFLLLLRSRIPYVVNGPTVRRMLSAVPAGIVAVLPVLALRSRTDREVVAIGVQIGVFSILLLFGYVVFGLLKVDLRRGLPSVQLAFEGML